ncbi:AraC family transcriptional regulator [Aquimarina sp. AD1]|uniref:AraC family transcriptional regulator n=1 Tax=Aquimarina sp. (strain AD1) TaxID=1714848 RepID=UPI000E549EC3|nr:AraC family transcriptional regulator [Aquimarina sp. AD1]AXT58323.1 AraC family transcriptional regulator [Aquimarina sp. AD1]RKN15227.1 helix-turn-helix domain-containing protein [Aquimarina sp. AD1]
MKPSYEQIYLEQSKSLKIESYTKDSLCHEINWHLHPEYEIVFIKNGSGIIQVESHLENYQDGLLIFLSPNMPHMPFGNKDFRDNVEVVIQFNEDFIEEKLHHFPEFSIILDFIKKSPKGCIFSQKIKDELSASFLRLSNQNNIEKLLNFINILYRLSISKNYRSIIKTNHLEIDKTSLPRISKVFEYVNKNYAKKIKSETLAKELGLTTNSFCRIFKSSTGKNFISFLNEFRIKKAQELFYNSNNMSISEVLYQCGFNDPSYFCKLFKKQTGLSPSAYIKALK